MFDPGGCWWEGFGSGGRVLVLVGGGFGAVLGLGGGGQFGGGGRGSSGGGRGSVGGGRWWWWEVWAW